MYQIPGLKKESSMIFGANGNQFAGKLGSFQTDAPMGGPMANSLMPSMSGMSVKIEPEENPEPERKRQKRQW